MPTIAATSPYVVHDPAGISASTGPNISHAASMAVSCALGFGPGHLTLLIFGESLAIAGFGSALGIALTFPVAEKFGKSMGTLFPVFYVNAETLYMQAAAGLIVGAVAALLPCVRAAHIRIVDGLRSVG